MADEWGAGNFKKVVGLDFKEVNGLSNAVAALPVSAKKAFYAAATARTIHRGNWNGCAFNAGGIEIGQRVNSVGSAARAFGCTTGVVSRFIRFWDGLVARDDDEATGILREKLEEVGLFTEPNAHVQIVSYSVWRDEQRAEVKKFVEELEATDFLCDGMEEATELLFANA